MGTAGIRNTVLAAVWLGACGSVWPLALGPERVQAVIGRPLEVQLPLYVGADEGWRPDCVEAEVFFGEDRLGAAQLRVGLEPSDTGGAGEARLRISTVAPINEPIVSVKVRAGCRLVAVRQFVAFAEPPAERLSLPGGALPMPEMQKPPRIAAMAAPSSSPVRRPDGGHAISLPVRQAARERRSVTKPVVQAARPATPVGTPKAPASRPLPSSVPAARRAQSLPSPKPVPGLPSPPRRAAGPRAGIPVPTPPMKAMSSSRPASESLPQAPVPIWVEETDAPDVPEVPESTEVAEVAGATKGPEASQKEEIAAATAETEAVAVAEPETPGASAATKALATEAPSVPDGPEARLAPHAADEAAGWQHKLQERLRLAGLAGAALLIVLAVGTAWRRRRAGTPAGAWDAAPAWACEAAAAARSAESALGAPGAQQRARRPAGSA